MTTVRPKRVYVAGPITLGNQIMNVRTAVMVGTQLLDMGFAPYVPHLNFIWDFLTPRHYETWLALDKEWIKVCDALLRLPGESEGADREVQLANDLGIPVYYSIEELEFALKGKFYV